MFCILSKGISPRQFGNHNFCIQFNMADAKAKRSIDFGMASEQVEMRNGEDHTSSSESDVDAEEKAVDSKIQKLILESEANPYQYDKHIELITALRSTGDLEQLRNAREAMSNVYPLSEELWLEWFQDELPLAVIPELKEYLLTRFELAVKDYASTKVWHEYCQFAMNNIESPTDIDRARNVFERAITAAGLHITEGASIWDGYREFEIAILDSYQQLQDSGDTVGMDAKVEAQIERIATIFKRQLSVPLIGMENVFSIYKDWSPEPISDQTKRAYDKASQKLTLCMEHEEKLHNATEGKLELYKSYIAFEIKSGDPTRIQCIFERAIKDNCLQHDLWISYTNYLDYKLKIPVVCVPVHERAIRNCPWVCQLWVNYLRAMERNNEDYSKVKDVFDRSLKGGFPNAEDYLKVWIAMCDYHRRSITDWNIDDEKVDELRKTFENGITYMNHYFGLEGDKYCTLMREWAFIEAKYLQNVKRSQELWDTVMKKHARDSNMWLEYVQFLMLFTDTLAIRKVFQRCVQITLDSPEPICEEFIRFERRFGSLYEVDDAQQKVEVQLKKLKERREKEALKDLSTQKPSHDNKKKQNKKHEEKKKKKRPSTDKKPPSSNKSTPSSFQGKESLKRSIHQTFSNEDNHQQPNVKKSKNDYEKPIASSTNNPVPQETVVAMETIQTAPQSPHAYQTESILQSSTQTIGEPTSTQPSTDIPRDEQQPAKHLGMGGIMNRLQEMATAPTATDVADKKDEQDKVDNERSVFLSNLLFSVDDQAIRQMFSHCGDINTVRIITNRAGKSKGFAYLEFKDKESVSKALVLDRTNLNCRPVFVSNCVDKKENPTKFKFPTTIDKHTLYVSNIAFEVTEDQLRDEFQQIGNLKQVRLVTNRSGKFKGYAYVEYENETDAKSAILKFDQYMFHGRPMNVAISNPPARKNPELQQQKQQEQQHQKSATKTFEGPRGKAKTQISLVPRAVQKSTTSQQQPSSSGESEKDGRGSTTTNVAKSNADFRQFLLKK